MKYFRNNTDSLDMMRKNICRITSNRNMKVYGSSPRYAMSDKTITCGKLHRGLLGPGTAPRCSSLNFDDHT